MSGKVIIWVTVAVALTSCVVFFLVSDVRSRRAAFEERCIALGGVYILGRYDLKCIKGTELHP